MASVHFPQTKEFEETVERHLDDPSRDRLSPEWRGDREPYEPVDEEITRMLEMRAQKRAYELHQEVTGCDLNFWRDRHAFLDLIVALHLQCLYSHACATLCNTGHLFFETV